MTTYLAQALTADRGADLCAPGDRHRNVPREDVPTVTPAQWREIEDALEHDLDAFVNLCIAAALDPDKVERDLERKAYYDYEDTKRSAAVRGLGYAKPGDAFWRLGGVK